jgi:hypothetical protein
LGLTLHIILKVGIPLSTGPMFLTQVSYAPTCHNGNSCVAEGYWKTYLKFALKILYIDQGSFQSLTWFPEKERDQMDDLYVRTLRQFL